MTGKEVGPYKILERIGEGGVGIVYRGVHVKLEQKVAIKVLSPQFSEDERMLRRFFREAKIQAGFSHPNVVKIINYLESEGNTYIVMEYVNGETLENIIKKEQKLSLKKAASISFGVLEALEFMHSNGVIHRDIKPGNIMITDEGAIKVTDFGIAKVMGEKVRTKTGMLGSFLYISPEQILGQETSVASDIYSFGITLYQMVTGMVPFSGDSEYKIMRGHLEEEPPIAWKNDNGVPEGVGRIILKALSKNPKDRYQNARDLAEDLRVETERFNDMEMPAKTPKISESGDRAAGALSKRLPLTILSAAIICLLVLSIWSNTKRDLSSSTAPPPDAADASASEVSGSAIARLDLDTGFDLSVPDDLVSSYVLSALEQSPASKTERLPKQVSESSQKRRKGFSSGWRIIEPSEKQIEEKESLEEMLKGAFLLPNP